MDRLVRILVYLILKKCGFMNTDLKPSKTCLSLVLKFEGFDPMPYICPAGYWTVGIGTRIKSKEDFLKKHPNGITFTEAQDELMAHMEKVVEPSIKTQVKVALTQNQFDALLSFIYNVGADAFAKSTLLKLLNEKDFSGAAKEFRKWNKGTVRGALVVLAGLTRRRAAEELLFEDKEWRIV